MERWTNKELEEIDDISFAICILNKYKNKISPLTPLGIKLNSAVKTLSEIRTGNALLDHRTDDKKVSKQPPKVSWTDCFRCGGHNTMKLTKSQRDGCVRGICTRCGWEYEE